MLIALSDRRWPFSIFRPLFFRVIAYINKIGAGKGERVKVGTSSRDVTFRMSAHE